MNAFAAHRFELGALMVSSVIVFIARPAVAETRGCDTLPAERMPVLREVLASLHPYDGCDATFEKCLAKKPVAPVVERLVNDICRQIRAGKGKKEIEHALARRAQSVLPMGKPAGIALDATMAVGDSAAPVALVVYACARCPFCKVIVPALYRQVTEGSLTGRVRLYFRPFPLRDHPGSLEGGLAMMAAAKLGRFWPFLLKVYDNYDAFCPQLFPEWAEEVGLGRADFEREYSDPRTREALVASKQEGIRNEVEATPALFINGRKYVYEMQQDVIVDVLQEAAEAGTASGKRP